MFLPDFCPGQSEEPMVNNSSRFELDPGISESGIPLCCGQGISSDDWEVAESFLSQSFSSKHSSHKIQVQM